MHTVIVKDIEKMNFEELRETVKFLSEELIRFKRLFEDEVYNIDNSKLATSVKKERDNMRSQLTISSNKIESIVEDVGKQNSKITQTADSIKMIVEKQINIEGAKVITSLDILDNPATDKKETYVFYTTDENGNRKSNYYCWIGEDEKNGEWVMIGGENIYSVFEQTEDGFNLKGNVVIDGSAVVTKNLKLQGNVTWDMSNSPVKTRYSADKTVWHEEFIDGDKWLQMSFDGGKNWTEPPTKVVGTDGKNGTNGTDATVDAESIFNVLTNNGDEQGIFPAFVAGDNKIYINAEYIASNTIKIGSLSTVKDEKMLQFNGLANISTFDTGRGDHAGLEVSAERFKIKNGRLDLSECTGITWGNNLPKAGVAVFG